MAACRSRPRRRGVLVRDSKNPEGPALAVPALTWQALLRTLTP
ncbi:MAG: DUF397 domain-containing protein [Pseudonocardiaceae bacterium]